MAAAQVFFKKGVDHAMNTISRAGSRLWDRSAAAVQRRGTARGCRQSPREIKALEALHQ